jgi:excinuclease ABC subunit C
MEEVIYRRYKRMLDEKNPLPQLIIIDGGKGQVSAAIKSLEELKLSGTIPVIGIAKKLEEIFHTRYSGYPGGLKILKGSYTVEKKGYAELIKLAIYHMLPGNKLRREMVKNLVVTE